MHAGITLSWPSDTVLNHLPVLSFNVEQNPPRPAQNASSAFIREAELFRRDQIIPLDDTYVWADITINCNDAFIFFPNPDTVTVVRGRKSELRMTYGVGADGYGSAEVMISDDFGWVQSFSPNVIEGRGCVICEWDWHDFVICVDVPADAGLRDTNVFRLEGVNAPFNVNRTFYVRVVDPVPIQLRTFGGIKALYNR